MTPARSKRSGRSRAVVTEVPSKPAVQPEGPGNLTEYVSGHAKTGWPFPSSIARLVSLFLARLVRARLGSFGFVLFGLVYSEILRLGGKPGSPFLLSRGPLPEAQQLCHYHHQQAHHQSGRLLLRLLARVE